MKKPFHITKILIPLDFSDTSRLALEHAAHICSKFKADLHLLHVFTGSKADVLPNITATDANTSDNEGIKDKILDELDGIGKEFYQKYNVGYNIEVREGSVSKEIAKTAKEVDASMIVLGTHGVSGFEEFFLGSNAYRVVTAATMPVFTVQGHADKLGYDDIVLPIDSSKHTRDKVSQAATIAKAFDATVHIATLVTEEHEDEEAIFNLKIKQVEEYFDGMGVKHRRKVLHGDDVAEMTIEFAKSVNADLIVAMTEQEAATGLFMGPYAQRVVNHSPIPVMSVTPLETIKGFSQRTLGGDYRPFYI